MEDKGLTAIVTFNILICMSGRNAAGTPLYPVEDVTEVEGVEGGNVKLPCDLFPIDKEDKINLILWYKNDEKDPIYSYDARLAVFSSERHHLKESFLKGRVTFAPSPGAPIPHRLTLSRLQQVDAGSYTCRVDFTMAQSSTRGVLLKVVTPVNSLQILDSQGRRTPSVLDPIPEGGTLNITCTARGGRPQPSVSWWFGEAMVDDSWTEVAKGVVSNNLVISPLTRTHAHAVLTCRAMPSIVAVTTATVTIDMYLRPESVEITAGGKSGTIRAGEYLDLSCTARGSRPAPLILWYKGSEAIPTKNPSRSSVMGVSSVSHARVKIHTEDNGVRVTCRVMNPKLPHHTLQEHITLNVTYPPQVELRMGSKMDGPVVNESTSVYMTCHLDANPKPHTLIFTHQGKAVKSEMNKGVLINGEDLIINKINESQSGVYSCKAENTQGTGVSPPLNITVLHSPICQTNKTIEWAEPGSLVNASCRVRAFPANKIHFFWVWKFKDGSIRIQPAIVKVKGLTSTVSYIIPKSYNKSNGNERVGEVLGTLECWASNGIGKQRSPCQVQVRKPVFCSKGNPRGSNEPPCTHPNKQQNTAQPSAPKNCTWIRDRLRRVIVECHAESTSSTNAPHSYELRVVEARTNKLHFDVKSHIPRFIVENLTEGIEYTAYVASHTLSGGKPYTLVEAFNLNPASENRIRGTEIEPMSWMTIIIFVSAVGGVILLILFITTLIRFRLRRSQHKCTVRRTPSSMEPKLADKNLYLDSPQDMPPSSGDKRAGDEMSSNQQQGGAGGLSPTTADSLNPPSIIHQTNPPRLQPIIKENGRAEPVRSSQPRTVLFVEPPSKTRGPPIEGSILKDTSNTLYPGRRGVGGSTGGGLGPPKGLNGDVRSSLYPLSTRSAYQQPPLTQYPDRDPPKKFRLSASIDDDLPDPDDVYETQFASGSPNVLGREPSNYCSPRQPPLGVPYRGVQPPSISAPHSSNPPPPGLRDPREIRDIRDTLRDVREPVRDSRDLRDPISRDTRDHREPTARAFTSYTMYEPPPPPPLVRSSSSPPPPRPSIMKKSPSVGGSISRRHHDPHAPPPHGPPSYRSLPRPNKTRHSSSHESDLVRYRSLDRRFDIPFTGSLPRPQTRRGSRSERRLQDYPGESGSGGGGRFDGFRSDQQQHQHTRLSDTRLDKSDSFYDSRPDGRYDSRSSVRSLRDSSSIPQRRTSTGARLRFSNEKYFHVYPDRDKRQSVDDDGDENFV